MTRRECTQPHRALAVLAKHLRQRAVALYSQGDTGTSVTDLFSGSVLDGARRKRLADGK